MSFFFPFWVLMNSDSDNPEIIDSSENSDSSDSSYDSDSSVGSIDSTDSLESRDSNDFIEFAGQVFGKRYLVIRFLGYGTFSNVFLAYDCKLFKPVVLKVQQPEHLDDALEEIEVMKKLCVSNSPHVVQLLDSFQFKQEESTFFVFVLELLGQDLFSLLDEFDCLPFHSAVSLIQQLLKALDFVHSNGYMHTDIKLENLLLTQIRPDVTKLIHWFESTFDPKSGIQKYRELLPSDFADRSKNGQTKAKRKAKENAPLLFAESIKPKLEEYIRCLDFHASKESFPSDLSIKLSDFGGAFLKNEDPELVQTRQYRAPEVIVGSFVNEKIDIWSVGCLLFELLTSDPLFDVHDTSDEIEDDRTHLQAMAERLGKMPLDLYDDCELADDLFDQKGRVIGYKRVEYQPIEDDLTELTDLSPDQIQLVTSFIKKCCCYFTKQRDSANSLLSDPIFQN